jgi:hypothetical protein
VVNIERNQLQNIELEKNMIFLKFLHSTPDMTALLVPAHSAIHTSVTSLHFTLHYITLITYLFTYLLTYLITYSLTPWSTGLLEKLTGSQTVKKFPALNGTQRFITAFTSAHHMSFS